MSSSCCSAGIVLTAGFSLFVRFLQRSRTNILIVVFVSVDVVRRSSVSTYFYNSVHFTYSISIASPRGRPALGSPTNVIQPCLQSAPLSLCLRSTCIATSPPGPELSTNSYCTLLVFDTFKILPNSATPNVPHSTRKMLYRALSKILFKSHSSLSQSHLF